MNDRQRNGSIQVSIKGLQDTFGSAAAVGARVDILDKQLRLLQQTDSLSTIEISPGSYVIAITLPDGSRHVDIVAVKAGEATPVRLTWNSDPIVAVRSRAQSHTGAKALLGPAPNSFNLRFIEISGNLEAAPAVTRPQQEVDHYGRADGVLTASMIVYAPPGSNRVYFAEIATEHESSSVAVALPAAAIGAASNCWLNVAISAERLEVDVRMRGSSDADAISQLMASGQLAAAAVPAAAEAMLYREPQHPFGAALAGYALLRLKKLDQLHGWPEKLASWFDWLPDAHIILGEQRLRAGKADEALGAFGQAMKRGLPVFTDGFSILQARLRRLAAGNTIPEIPKAAKDEASRRLEALSQWTPWVAFETVCTTLKHDEEQPAVTAARGWERFRQPFGQARDPRDFWSEPAE